MNKKIITLLVILLFSLSCMNLASAENNTTESQEIDMTDYIMPVTISNGQIEFSDAFTGFCIDDGNVPTTDDGYVVGQFKNDELENHIKLAIMECYSQGREGDIAQIVASFVDGSYKKSNDEVIQSVLDSDKNIGDSAVENINDTTEATFNFELLKSSNNETSDCLAYTVSLKTVAKEDVLGAGADNETDDKPADDDADDSKDDSAENETEDIKEDVAEDNNDTTSDDKSDTNSTNDDENASGTSTGKTIVNEKNTTIINKTKTTIINENNTTVINNTNIKHINNTTNDTPENATVTDTLMKTAGNPIFLLVIVVIIIAAAAYAMKRKE